MTAELVPVNCCHDYCLELVSGYLSHCYLVTSSNCYLVTSSNCYVVTSSSSISSSCNSNNGYWCGCLAVQMACWVSEHEILPTTTLLVSCRSLKCRSISSSVCFHKWFVALLNSLWICFDLSMSWITRATWLRWPTSLDSKPSLLGSFCRVIVACTLRLNSRAGTKVLTVSSLSCDYWLILGLETLCISRCLNHWQQMT